MLSLLDKLPDEIIIIVREYIPYHILTWLSKTNYDKYHTRVIQKHINDTYKNINTYFRYIIRMDNDIALLDMLNNHPNFNSTKIKYNNSNNGVYHNHNQKIKYKNKKYATYYDFLLYLSIENDKPSTKCKNILIEYVKK